MPIKFGPAGLGPVKEAARNLEEFHRLGLRACEIAFTYGVYIKESQKKEIEEIRKTAEKLEIRLSIHAPYWINLNSKEKRKIEESKKRILACCFIGEKLGVKDVVFHPGYYAGMDKEKTYENIKKEVIEMLKYIKEKKWKIKIAAETMGKINVFGSVEEIAKLVDETGCSFAIDFAHILARDKKVDFEKINKLFGNHEKWHCHFSGIVYGERGERHHKKTEKEEWKELLKNLPKGKDITIINESPSPVEDAVEGMKMSKSI